MTRGLKIGLALILIGIGLVAIVSVTSGSEIFQNGEEYYTYYEEEYAADTFSSFAFDFDNRRVYIYESTDDKIRLSYYLHEKDESIFDDETVEMSLSITRKWYLNFSLFNFTNTKYFEVYLYLPSSLLDYSFDIDTSNGKIILDGIGACDSINLETSNGEIEVNNIEARVINLKTSNGEIKMTDVTVETNLKGDSSNGRVTLNNISADKIEMKTSNGKVKAENIAANNVKLDSSNGEIFLSIQGEQNSYRIVLNTTNGHRILGDLRIESGIINADKANSVELKSSNGDVEVQFVN